MTIITTSIVHHLLHFNFSILNILFRNHLFNTWRANASVSAIRFISSFSSSVWNPFSSSIGVCIPISLVSRSVSNFLCFSNASCKFFAVRHIYILYILTLKWKKYIYIKVIRVIEARISLKQLVTLFGLVWKLWLQRRQ